MPIGSDTSPAPDASPAPLVFIRHDNTTDRCPTNDIMGGMPSGEGEQPSEPRQPATGPARRALGDAPAHTSRKVAKPRAAADQSVAAPLKPAPRRGGNIAAVQSPHLRVLDAICKHCEANDTIRISELMSAARLTVKQARRCLKTLKSHRYIAQTGSGPNTAYKPLRRSDGTHFVGGGLPEGARVEIRDGVKVTIYPPRYARGAYRSKSMGLDFDL